MLVSIHNVVLRIVLSVVVFCHVTVKVTRFSFYRYETIFYVNFYLYIFRCYIICKSKVVRSDSLTFFSCMSVFSYSYIYRTYSDYINILLDGLLSSYVVRRVHLCRVSDVKRYKNFISNKEVQS